MKKDKMSLNKINEKVFKYISTRKLLLAVLCILIIMLTAIKHISKSFFDEVESQIKIELKQKVDIAYNSIRPIIDLTKKGQISKEEAKVQIKNLVRNMTYEQRFSTKFPVKLLILLKLYSIIII